MHRARHNICVIFKSLVKCKEKASYPLFTQLFTAVRKEHGAKCMLVNYYPRDLLKCSALSVLLFGLPKDILTLITEITNILSLSQAPYKTTELYSSFRYLLVQITKVKILF